MNPPPFEKLAVVGLGLLGGSVAAAAKERGLARQVVGAARRRGPLERALEAGIVDATKVVRIGLENAVSVASVLLLTEATMTEVAEESTHMPTEPGMGMGM